MKKIIFSLLLVFAICFARSEAAQIIRINNKSDHWAVRIEFEVLQRYAGPSCTSKTLILDPGKNGSVSLCNESGYNMNLFIKNLRLKTFIQNCLYSKN